MTKPVVIINAIHAKSGGGLVYLNKILPHLSRDFHWIIVVNQAVQEKIAVPDFIDKKVFKVPASFLLMHLWEQCVLPFLLRKYRPVAVLCNANYVPLLAPNPIPIVHTNTQVKRYEQRFAGKCYWWAVTLLTKLSLWRARGALSVASHILPHYGASQKKVAIANPAAPAVPQPAPRAADTLLAVGDLYVQKNYPLMVAALAELVTKRPAVHLTIIGRPLDPQVVAKLEAMIREHQLENNITIQGFVPHDQLLIALQKCTVYVNTSVVECFNMPVLEALSTGAPAVVLDHPFQREVAGAAACYAAPGVSPTAFAEILQTLLADDQERQRLSAAAIAQAGLFSWQKTAAVITAKINETLVEQAT